MPKKIIKYKITGTDKAGFSYYLSLNSWPSHPFTSKDGYALAKSSCSEQHFHWSIN